MKQNHFLMALLVLIIISSFVSAGIFTCNDIDICDDNGLTFSSGYNCVNASFNKDNVETERILVSPMTLKYDCSGTETFNFNYGSYYNMNFSDDKGYWNFDLSRFFGVYPLSFTETCASASQDWYLLYGIINDYNSLRSDYIRVDGYVYLDNGTEYQCPSKSFTPVDHSVNSISGDLKVMEPFIDSKIAKLYERSMMATSTQIFVSLFNSTESLTETDQETYINNICTDTDYIESGQCGNMGSDSDVINEAESKLVCDIDYISTTETLNSGITISDNITTVLKYHFNHTKTPLFIRTGNEWFYNFTGSRQSFIGYNYGRVIVGMEEQSPGVYYYWVMQPEGDLVYWSEQTLIDRWSLTNYAGYYMSKCYDTYDFDIYYKDGEGNIRNKDELWGSIGTYQPCLNLTDKMLYNTTNPYLSVNGSLYLPILNNTCLNDTISTSNYGLKYLNYSLITKSGQHDQIKNYSVISPSIISFQSSDLIYNDTYNFQINYTTNFLSNTTCVVYSEIDGDNIVFADTGYTYNHVCNMTILGSSVWVPNENVNITIYSGIGNNLAKYNLPNNYIPGIINYPLDVNPSFKSQCSINQNCTIIENYEISDYGSFNKNTSTEVLLYDQYRNHTYYDCGNDHEFSISFNPGTDYLRDNYIFNDVVTCFYDEIGNYTQQYCYWTNKGEYDCINNEVEVLYTFGGGGNSGGGGSLSENSSFLCEFNLNYDIDNLPSCHQTMLRHYWFDVDTNQNFDAIAYYDSGLKYLPDPDCVDGVCDVVLDRSGYNTGDYCNGYDLVKNSNPLSDTVDLYLCYNNNDFDVCDCNSGLDLNFTQWISFMGGYPSPCSTQTQINQSSFIKEDYCTDLGYFSNTDYSLYDYQICNSDYIYDNSTGYWCILEDSIDLECQYNCTLHDQDLDGVNDCTDVCCGGDDTIDTDSDGVPDDCDTCPNDQFNDIDNDGFCANDDNCPDVYNPTQYDTDLDGFGNACDVCEGGDDNIDTDGDGVPDYCDSNPGDPGTGDENGTDTSGRCSNGVQDIGESYIDYGGVCGTCEDGILSPYLNETDVDYGGVCGYCIPDTTKNKDWQYISLSDEYKQIPFNDTYCEIGDQTIGYIYGFIVVLVILLSLLLLIILSPLLFMILLSIRRILKKRKKKDSKL